MPAVALVKIKSLKRLPTLVGSLLIICLFLTRLISAVVVHKQLPHRLQDFLTLTTSVIIESLPFVLLGILLSILVQVWLPDQFIIKLLPKRPPLRRLCIACLGVFFPVCECGNVPLARGLIVQGFTVAESLVFLLAAPIINPITIFTTHQAFRGDNTILIGRLLGGLLIANIVGWLYSKHKQPKQLLTPAFAAACAAPDTHQHDSRLSKSIQIFSREANSILPALFIGAGVAGAIQTIVPRTVLTTLGANPIWSIVAMLLLAFVVSICSNVDAFFALAFANTFTAGSLVSFLVFGPIIDIKMLSLMRTTYRPKVLIQIAVVVTLIAAAAGLVVNYAF